MTMHEIKQIENRVYQIMNIVQLCDTNRDQDILDNLEAELINYINILENNLKNKPKVIKLLVRK